MNNKESFESSVDRNLKLFKRECDFEPYWQMEYIMAVFNRFPEDGTDDDYMKVYSDFEKSRFIVSYCELMGCFVKGAAGDIDAACYAAYLAKEYPSRYKGLAQVDVVRVIGDNFSIQESMLEERRFSLNRFENYKYFREVVK